MGIVTHTLYIICNFHGAPQWAQMPDKVSQPTILNYTQVHNIQNIYVNIMSTGGPQWAQMPVKVAQRSAALVGDMTCLR